MTLTRAALAVVRSVPFLLCLYVVGLNASVGRPLWIDEFTHFAFAAEPTTRDVWNMFVATADYNQHGQTGIYILLNYWTLSYLGVDATLLRLPSILSGMLLLVSAVVFLRVLGFSVLWQIVMVAALTGQHLLMYFVGEARAYTPIPAAAVGLLLYYVLRPLYPLSWAVLGFGAFAALFGATMHPYFAIYWPAVCLVAYVHCRTVTGQRFSLRSLVAFANPGLVAIGAGLYFLLGALTWMRDQPRFGFDPYEWLHQYGPLANFTDYSHTQFLAGQYGLAGGLTGIVVLGAVLLPARLRGDARTLLAPTLLILLSVLLSLLLGCISYLADYWILPRQWVGSVALIAVGLVWLWAEAARIWSRLTPLLGVAVCATALLVVSGQAMNIHRVKLHQLLAYLAEPTPARDVTDCVPPAHLNVATLPNDERNRVVVDLANRNIACGGPVWTVFREYYNGPPAGLREQQAAAN
ncbi:hypothetical protein AAFN86_08500 [Roseomonas sp. CAU 1739]|uniref:hypothetical protein n=1 Tax=Roseomonas sp. CAU 1739 TaxID=3140364 RepID=UPI00325C007A